jgi:hypothetical protein
MKSVIGIIVLCSVLYIMCTLCFVHDTTNYLNKKIGSLQKYVYFENFSDKNKYLQKWRNEIHQLPFELVSLI